MALLLLLLTDGVFYIRGATHHSVAVEFRDHVVVVEGPLNEQRSLAVDRGSEEVDSEQADPLSGQHTFMDRRYRS